MVLKRNKLGIVMLMFKDMNNGGASQFENNQIRMEFLALLLKIQH